MRSFILLVVIIDWAKCQESQPQCQCVTPPPGTSQPCLPYDSRFQAATLQEAMISFPDLTIDQEEPGQIATLKEKEACQTKECAECQNEMKKKLMKVEETTR
ncbi:hypothetical protein COOONC_27896 [Cooperia oncophora]